jgi:hypothetical protein
MSETPLSENHTIHSILAGGGVYLLLNKNGNKNALKYASATSVALYLYMSVFQHNIPSFEQQFFAGFNKK